VLMSAMARGDTKSDTMNADFDKVLTKPIDFDYFIEFLEAAYAKSIFKKGKSWQEISR